MIRKKLRNHNLIEITMEWDIAQNHPRIRKDERQAILPVLMNAAE